MTKQNTKAPKGKKTKSTLKKSNVYKTKLKKPPNAYFVFIAEQRKKLQSDDNTEKHNNNLTTCERAKLWGKRWKTMTPEDKAPYIAISLTKKQEYAEKVRTQKELINAS